MRKIFTASEINALWEEGINTRDIICRTDNLETLIRYQHSLLQGESRKIQLRPGLSLSICDWESQHNVGIKFQHDALTPLILAFWLSGQCRVLTETVKDDYYYEKVGENYLFFVPGTAEINEHIPGDRRVRIKILVDPSIIRTYSVGQIDLLPTELQPFIKGENLPLFHRTAGPITPAMQLALQQILNCPYQGLMKKIYLESKALELMTLQFAQLTENNKKNCSTLYLQPNDINQIYQAKEILLKNLDDPPSLPDLARQVGINENKLKRGFRQVFGTTVFGYLQAYRMERAKQLLAERLMSVAGVARAVGYTSQSRFGDAFKRHFGITPKSYQTSLNS